MAKLGFNGIETMPSGCGACINAGRGITRENEVAISNFNRNYKKRNGLGSMYLGNTPTVVASALKGEITAYRPGMFNRQH